MAKLSDEQERALKVLAGHPGGYAEQILLEEGFSICLLSGLAIDGFATLERKRTSVDGQERTVLWMQITEVGRQAIAE
jgi:hypothetical protein